MTHPVREPDMLIYRRGFFLWWTQVVQEIQADSTSWVWTLINSYVYWWLHLQKPDAFTGVCLWTWGRPTFSEGSERVTRSRWLGCLTTRIFPPLRLCADCLSSSLSFSVVVVIEFCFSIRLYMFSKPQLGFKQFSRNNSQIVDIHGIFKLRIKCAQVF